MSPDITLASGMWHDLYVATGITPGTRLLVYNKGSTVAHLWEGSMPGGLMLSEGVPIFSGGEPQIADQVGVTGCWIASLGSLRLNVQEYVE